MVCDFYTNLSGNPISNDPIATLVSAGIINSSEQHKFQSDIQINRAEIASLMCATLSKFFTFDIPQNPTFKDVSTSDPNFGAIQALGNAEIMSGYADGTFRGDRKMTRYEFALTIANLLEKINDR